MKILVTGGAGFLGSILCEYLLAKNYNVTVVDNLSYKQKSLFHLCASPNFEFVFGDVRDEELMRKLIKDVDVIIPLAAVVGTPLCEQDPILATGVNLDAIKLINKIRSKNQWVIYPTTNGGYITKSDEMFCTEDTPLKPVSHYGKTKSDAEGELLGSDNVISLRLATVFGMSPRMRLDALVNSFVYIALKDGNIVIFEKNFKRNFVYIRDVAECFIHCIVNFEHMKGKPYNLGLSTNLSKEELALKIKEHIPNFIINFSDVGSDPDKRNYVVSNQRLKDSGFEAKTSLDQGIKELIKGYHMIIRNES